MKEAREKIMAIKSNGVLVYLFLIASVIGIFFVAAQLDKNEKQKWITSNVLLGRGIDLDQEYSLLALQREGDVITRTDASFSGGFFFLIGGVSGGLKSTTQTEYFVGFVADLAGQPTVLRLPASKFDFQFAQVAQPQVHLLVLENIWKPSFRERNMLAREEKITRTSTTHILEQDLGRVVITLSPEQFSEDIAVLQYAYQGMR